MGRAKRKLITQKMALSLVDANGQSGTPEQKKSYWNTYHCQNKIYTADGRLYGKYCKNRCCTLCCSIRKAKIINQYLPVIKTWADPYFVTLTIKAVPAIRLRLVLEKVLQGFQKIKDKYRKRHLRGKDIKLIGVKSLECNFNPKTKTYNPHLHLIVASREIAEILEKEWLSLWKGKWSNRKGQKIRKAKDTVRDLIEIVKYGSKIFTEPDVNQKAKKAKTEVKEERSVYAAALDNIFVAMKDLRIFDRFGFNLPGNPASESKSTIVKEYREWLYDPNYSDWLNIEDGHCLTDYQPEGVLLYLLNNNIDIQLE